jgi:hypothetical protein
MPLLLPVLIGAPVILGGIYPRTPRPGPPSPHAEAPGCIPLTGKSALRIERAWGAFSTYPTCMAHFSMRATGISEAAAPSGPARFMGLEMALAVTRASRLPPQ